MNATPTFEEFFTGVYNYPPYLWQKNISAQFLNGNAPQVLDVPTGMGKSSVVAAWLWAFAHDQYNLLRVPDAKRLVPTRMHFVVDRRIIVDSIAQQARELADAIDNPQTDATHWVAKQLEHLKVDDQSLLAVASLRGGTTRPEYITNPITPTVITSTIDQFGSRILWRGYSVSPSRRPIEAALAGTDTLIVLDEAHLSSQFVSLLDDLDRQARAQETWAGTLPPRQVMTMSATNAQPHGRILSADIEAERNNSSFFNDRYMRRNAVEIFYNKDQTVEDAAQGLLERLTYANQSGVVFVNTVQKAKSLSNKLNTQAKKSNVELVTLIGGMPAPIADEKLACLAPFKTGASRNAERPVLVIATQTLEVGADIDFTYGVSEIASRSAITQRLGRVNRMGNRNDGDFLIVGPGDEKSIYADSAVHMEAFLESLVASAPGTIQLRDLLEKFASYQDDTKPLDPPLAPSLPLSPAELEELLDTHNDVSSMDVSKLLRPASDPYRCEIVFRDKLDQLIDLGTQESLETYLEHTGAPTWERWSVSITALTNIKSPALIVDRNARVYTFNNLSVKHGSDLIGATIYLPSGNYDKDILKGAGEDISGYYPEIHRPYLINIPRDIDIEDDDNRQELFEQHNIAINSYLEPLDDDYSIALVLPPKKKAQHKVAVRELLTKHNGEVGDLAEQWAKLVGLDDVFTETIKIAGHRHDLGKTDRGFQYLLHLSQQGHSYNLIHKPDNEILAKSNTPVHLRKKARYLAQRMGGLHSGYRHEAGSAQVSDDFGYPYNLDALLIRHLILSHHGHWRGLGPTMNGPHPYVYQDVNSQAYAEIPRTFRELNEKYGPYTLAYLETILRLADWHISSK